ncbi:MAG: biotin transporter BioY [Oscillospiraceae bacterium]|nr:biotin transporter BioY [Oscillospiraceae bacterium]
MTRKKFLSVREICYIAIFTALIAVLSPLAIPMPYGMPLTLQSFVVPFAAVVLGAKRGAIAVLAYVLLGAIGLPIFSNFRGGLGMLIGPTGGFIFAFPLYAFLAGWGADRGRWYWLAGGLLAGVVVLFGLGTVQFSFVTERSLAESFTIAALPFLPMEGVKLALVWVLGQQVRKALARAGTLG